jgi:hypothetical protein
MAANWLQQPGSFFDEGQPHPRRRTIPEPRRGTKPVTFRLTKSCGGVFFMAMHQRSNWTPAIVSNRDTKVADDVTDGAPGSALHFASSAASMDQKIQHRADVRFAIGVALAMALPAIIGFGIYVAAESIILRAS